MSSADELRAALAVAELEEQLKTAKDNADMNSPEYTALKRDLREARRAYRQQREGTIAEVAE